ncbi:class I adenylate-forming enzyme family protein [Lignipirellula cremea]|uniref:Long-chain-fatty-acid--CoA ligase n=1 Tax=Lignipirellula cremea TaxID=2528010 RepID=A0A518DVM7_9BACT|nr:class I adenylate-forming enzyme family protein [Lignipirellula cremea]QDU95891.1 Long-chain-fatty-acid--CoA ligase [Lignipirellula cremea]
MNERSPLQALLDGPLRENPDKIVLRTDAGQLTCRELHEQAGRVAAGLQRCGVQSGDRVAWVLPNGIEAVLATLACYRLGAVAVPLNVRYVASEVRDVIERVDPRVIIFDVACDAALRPVLESNRQRVAVTVGAAEDSSKSFASLQKHAQFEDQPVGADHPALILFTSGSTGRPKGVVHSHQGAYGAIDASRQLFDFKADDIVLVGKPICHAGGLQTQLLPALLAGCQVILAMKPTPAAAVALLQSLSVTEYGLLASDLLDFIEYLEARPVDLPSLKYGIGSGDTVPVDLHQRFRELFGWEIMEGAGMTEIGCYYAANPRYGKRKWGSLGLPAPGVELKIVDEAGVACSPDQTGEILLRTSSAMTGYWNDPEATAEIFHDGWLHTGDLAYRDADDYVWFVGRKKLMIVRRGSNIAPIELENILDEHPRVHASVVVGIPDRRDGQVPVACVAAVENQRDLLEGELRDYAASRLSAYKNPAHYLFLEDLPRNGVGKFDRHKLQELAEQAFAG